MTTESRAPNQQFGQSRTILELICLHYSLFTRGHGGLIDVDRYLPENCKFHYCPTSKNLLKYVNDEHFDGFTVMMI